MELERATVTDNKQPPSLTRLSHPLPQPSAPTDSESGAGAGLRVGRAARRARALRHKRSRYKRELANVRAVSFVRPLV